jgi:hypothetical protein
MRQELGPGVVWAMHEQPSYCQRIALECGKRAEESTDEDVRTFLLRMRDNWLRVASGLEASDTKMQRPDARRVTGKTH